MHIFGDWLLAATIDYGFFANHKLSSLEVRKDVSSDFESLLAFSDWS